MQSSKNLLRDTNNSEDTMNIKETMKFALGAALFVPVILAEEGMKKAGMEVSEKGWNYNKEGQSITEIWRETGKEVKARAAEEKLVNDMLEANQPKTVHATTGFVIPEGV